jgi:hypothetical protein
MEDFKVLLSVLDGGTGSKLTSSYAYLTDAARFNPDDFMRNIKGLLGVQLKRARSMQQREEDNEDEEAVMVCFKISVAMKDIASVFPSVGDMQ